MTANNKPWQAIVNNSGVVKLMGATNPLVVVKQNSLDKGSYTAVKVMVPKRYSFDDNGGGYLGL